MHSQAARRVFSKVMHCMLHGATLPSPTVHLPGLALAEDLAMEPS